MTRALDDADRRFLERVAEDCEQLLGTDIQLRDLSVSHEGPTVLRVSYSLGGHDATSVGRGESLIEAHADLRARLVVDRIRLGAQALIEGTR